MQERDAHVGRGCYLAPLPDCRPQGRGRPGTASAGGHHTRTIKATCKPGEATWDSSLTAACGAGGALPWPELAGPVLAGVGRSTAGCSAAGGSAAGGLLAGLLASTVQSMRSLDRLTVSWSPSSYLMLCRPAPQFPCLQASLLQLLMCSAALPSRRGALPSVCTCLRWATRQHRRHCHVQQQVQGAPLAAS